MEKHNANKPAQKSPVLPAAIIKVLKSVPYFNGYNIPLSQFIQACYLAKNKLFLFLERNLVPLLINKLFGRAYYAVQNKQCDTIAQLEHVLEDALNPLRNSKDARINEYRNKLSQISLNAKGNMRDYISHVKTLRALMFCAIKDSRADYVVKGDIMPNDIIVKVDTFVAKSFCEGLPSEFRAKLSHEHYIDPFKAFSYALFLAKRNESDRDKFKTFLQNDDTFDWSDLGPIGNPLAHSTLKWQKDVQPKFLM